MLEGIAATRVISPIILSCGLFRIPIRSFIGICPSSQNAGQTGLPSSFVSVSRNFIVFIYKMRLIVLTSAHLDSISGK